MARAHPNWSMNDGKKNLVWDVCDLVWFNSLYTDEVVLPQLGELTIEFTNPDCVSIFWRTMKSKERFLAALNLGQLDRVPLFDFLDSQNLFENLTGHRPSQYKAKEAVEAAFKLGHDAVMIAFGGAVPYQNERSVDIYVDEWGTRWKKTGYSWPVDAPIAYPIKTRDDLRKVKIPDPTIPERLNDIRTAIELTKNKITIIGGILGPFSEVCYLMGLQALSIAVYDDPNLIIDLHKLTSEFFIEAAKRMIDIGIDAIVIFEDLAFHSGPFLSPAHFRKFT